MKYLFSLIILSFSVHAGLSFNQISNKIGEFSQSFVINDKLILVRDDLLWFGDGTVDGFYQPEVNNQKIQISLKQIFKTEEFVFFINKLDGDTLWKTDGSNLIKLSTDAVSLIYNFGSNVTPLILEDTGNLLLVDESNIYTYDVQSLVIREDGPVSSAPSFCLIDENNVIFKARDSEGSLALYLYKSGTITPIDLTDVDSTEIPVLEVQFEDHCYYKYYDEAVNKFNHYKIDNQGIVTLIENPEQGFYNDFFIFDNQLLMFLKNNYGSESNYIYRLLDDSVVPTQLNINSESFYPPERTWVTDDYLYVYYQATCTKSTENRSKCTPVPPDPFQLWVFDKSFQIVNTIKDYRLRYFSLDTTEDKDFLIYKDTVDELVELKNGILASSVKDPMVDISEVIGGNQENYYVIGINRLTNKKSIYKVSEQAVISKQLTGLWVSEGFQSQGLSIHTGIRSDGSEYIFVSFYIYRDGVPFWLAGNTELNNGAISQTINLTEYKGQSFLANDPNQDFEQINFGTMSIQPQSCNSIKVQINPVGEESILLDMDRIINTEFSNVCAD